MYDYVLANATIVDGSGRKSYKSNVAVFAGTIAFIGKENIKRAKTVIDLEGKILSPGFIDMHCHNDLNILSDRDGRSRIAQGITTNINGNCGIGTFPYSKPLLKDYVSDVLGSWPNWDWSNYSSWKKYVEKDGIGTNEAYLVSHTALRVEAMKDAGREATDEEIDTMCALLSEALLEGAYGLSTGLYYAPCTYASKKELLRLLSVVKEHDKLFAVHHRCEGNNVIASMREVLDLALESGVRIEISHLKAIGTKNQDKVDLMLSLIDEYRDKGVDVRFDQYPYIYGSTSMFSLLPPSILAYSKLEQRLALSLENEREDLKREILSPDGWDSVYELVGPDNIKAIYLETHPEFNDMTLSEIARAMDRPDPLDALFDILSEETGLAVMEDVTTTDENLKKIMAHPLMCFGSDSLYSSPMPHPRSYHASVEFISRYVRDEKVMTIEEGIRKLTYEAASRLGLKRGLIKEGYPADLVAFDLEKLSIGEGFANNGIEYVFVNGVEALSNGSLTGSRSGLVL